MGEYVIPAATILGKVPLPTFNFRDNVPSSLILYVRFASVSASGTVAV